MRQGPPAPWPSVTLDSEGLWAVAKNDSEDARAVLAASSEAGVPVVVPSVVLAETLFGVGRDARANQVLKKIHVFPVTELVARAAAKLKVRTGVTGVAPTIDAIVVATSAAFGGGVVLTSDSDDINALAEGAPGVRIRAVRV